MARYSSQLLLQDAVGRQPDRITHAPRLRGTRRSLGWQRPHHRENRDASWCPGSVATTGARGAPRLNRRGSSVAMASGGSWFLRIGEAVLQRLAQCLVLHRTVLADATS